MRWAALVCSDHGFAAQGDRSVPDCGGVFFLRVHLARARDDAGVRATERGRRGRRCVPRVRARHFGPRGARRQRHGARPARTTRDPRKPRPRPPPRAQARRVRIERCSHRRGEARRRECSRPLGLAFDRQRSQLVGSRARDRRAERRAGGVAGRGGVWSEGRSRLARHPEGRDAVVRQPVVRRGGDVGAERRDLPLARRRDLHVLPPVAAPRPGWDGHGDVPERRGRKPRYVLEVRRRRGEAPGRHALALVGVPHGWRRAGPWS